MRNIVFLLTVSFIYAAQCSKILVVFPTTARSHYILGNALARTLAEAGHDVTMVSPYEDKNPPKNGTYRDVILTGLAEEREKDKTVNFFNLGDMNPFINIPFMVTAGKRITKVTLEHPNFKKLIHSGESFDVVIVEEFLDDALKALGHYFKSPFILFSPLRANAWINPLVGNPCPLSYVPDILLSYSSEMTFWQRIVNTVFSVTSEINQQLVFVPAQNKMMKEHFPDAPDLSILNYNISLVLINAHESISQPVPHVPSMIDIGGYHISPPKELPKDLKDYLDNSKEGVVYFSMGSNLKPSQMSDEKRNAITTALGKLKQKVLWKWDEDVLPGKPDNVKLSKWFPQQDILAHPNVKLFITHGGLLSTIETVYHGVPVLALPIFGDQKINAGRAQMNGFGIRLVYSELTEETFSDALHKLLNDPKYRENAKKRSQLMADRPIKPKDLAVYWTEYVVRHRGAPHLRVAALDLAWYQYHLLDVISFLVIVTIGILTGLCIIIKKLCCGKKTMKQAKLKKN